MKSIFTLALCMIYIHAAGQRCGSALYQEQFQFMRSGASTTEHSSGRDTLPNEVIVVPIVVHVLYHSSEENISDAQILSQIKSLNQDFRHRNTDTANTPVYFKQFAADTRIVFCLAKVDPLGYKTSGITRTYTKEKTFLANDDMKFSKSGGMDGWDSKKYLNIWVCNLFGRMLGYAVVPGGPPERDGIVIKYTAFGTAGAVAAPFNKGRTTTHEMGHWLGLQHLWGSDDCGDDGIADTPPQEDGNQGCPETPQMSSCSVNAHGDMYMDYMDFTNDACMNMFTQGQKNKMRSLFAIGGPHNSFLSSYVCDGSGAEEAPPIPEDKPMQHVSVFPNPFGIQFTIKIAQGQALYGRDASIFNIDGRLIKTFKIEGTATIVNMEHVPSGMYVLRIQSDEGTIVKRLIKGAGGRQR